MKSSRVHVLNEFAPLSLMTQIMEYVCSYITVTGRSPLYSLQQIFVERTNLPTFRTLFDKKDMILHKITEIYSVCSYVSL